MDGQMDGWTDGRSDGWMAVGPTQPSATSPPRPSRAQLHPCVSVLPSQRPHHGQLRFASLLPSEAMEAQRGWWRLWEMRGLCGGPSCGKCPWGAGGAWGWAPCPGVGGVCAPSCSTVGLMGALSPPNPSWGHPWSAAPSAPTPGGTSGSTYLSPHLSPRGRLHVLVSVPCTHAFPCKGWDPQGHSGDLLGCGAIAALRYAETEGVGTECQQWAQPPRP